MVMTKEDDNLFDFVIRNISARSGNKVIFDTYPSYDTSIHYLNNEMTIKNIPLVFDENRRFLKAAMRIPKVSFIMSGEGGGLTVGPEFEIKNGIKKIPYQCFVDVVINNEEDED
jgi:hypothetical protein